MISGLGVIFGILWVLYDLIKDIRSELRGNNSKHITYHSTGKWKRCPKCRNNVPATVEKCYYCNYKF